MLEKGKINSFTVGELIVVMIVASIVVSLAILVLNIVQKEIYVIRRNFSVQDEIKLLERSVWRDLNTYELTISNNNKRELLFSNEIDTVSYFFGENKIIRNSDTLFVKVSEVKLYRNNIEVKSNVDAISLVLDDYRSKKLFFFKRNSAESYINNNGI